MHVSYTTDQPCASVGHPVGSLVIVYLWTLISDFRTPENPGFAVGYAPPFTRERKN
jgi:hypothetical protein